MCKYAKCSAASSIPSHSILVLPSSDILCCWTLKTKEWEKGEGGEGKEGADERRDFKAEEKGNEEREEEEEEEEERKRNTPHLSPQLQGLL